MVSILPGNPFSQILNLFLLPTSPQASSAHCSARTYLACSFFPRLMTFSSSSFMALIKNFRGALPVFMSGLRKNLPVSAYHPIPNQPHVLGFLKAAPHSWHQNLFQLSMLHNCSKQQSFVLLMNPWVWHSDIAQ